MAKHLGRASKMARYDITLPRQTIQRLKLVRAITGIPIKEWIRSQVNIACDLELCRRPGAFWLRPGSRIYRMETDREDLSTFVAVPLTVAFGGERVWIREIFPDLSVGEGDPGLDKDAQDGTILCDLSADEEGQVSMRSVLVASADCLPMAVAYTTGLGAVKTRKARERRRAVEAARRANAAQSGEG